MRLDDTDRRAVYISEGLGHAFMALTDGATVTYLCSTGYAPDREHGINPLDPSLNIPWPADVEPVLSPKDREAPSLAEAAERSLAADVRRMPRLLRVAAPPARLSRCCSRALSRVEHPHDHG